MRNFTSTFPGAAGNKLKKTDANRPVQGHEHVDDDVETAAALLQISEFQLFHIAYYQWYGRKTSDTVMEKFFVTYMFDGIVPPWARQLARKVLLLQREKNLNPGEFNIEQQQLTPQQKSAGMRYVLMFIIIMVAFCTMIANYASF